MLFYFVLFSNSGKRKKSESAMQPVAWMFSSFLSQSSSSSIQTQKAIQQQGWERRGREGSPLPSLHVSHCSSLVNVFPTPHLQPRCTSSSCWFHDLHHIILSSSAPHIYNFVLFFNFSQTVVAIRLSL